MFITGEIEQGTRDIWKNSVLPALFFCKSKTIGKMKSVNSKRKNKKSNVAFFPPIICLLSIFYRQVILFCCFVCAQNHLMNLILHTLRHRLSQKTSDQSFFSVSSCLLVFWGPVLKPQSECLKQCLCQLGPIFLWHSSIYWIFSVLSEKKMVESMLSL